MSTPVAPVAALLADLAARGVELAVEGDRLRYRPRAAVPGDVADRLHARKHEIVKVIGTDGGMFTTMELAVLAAAGIGADDVPEVTAAKMAFIDLGGLTLIGFEPAEPVTAVDDLGAEWREVYEERAAIMEFDGDLPRTQAEMLALRDILALKSGATRGLLHADAPDGNGPKRGGPE